MARFIVDIANIAEKDIKNICKTICDRIGEDDINYGIVTVNCIDKTDNNQFYNGGDYDYGNTNELSQEQIDNFKQVCNK